MGIKLETDDKGIKVIRKDGTSKAGNPYTMYSLMIPVKNGDEWTNVFIDAGFRKGVDLANKSKILIKDAFMTGNSFNGKTSPKIFVLDYELMEEYVLGKLEENPSADDFLMIPDGADEEMPFN